MESRWDKLQEDISVCSLCDEQFPRIQVNYPPGKLYPLSEDLPKKIKVLFIGVAPPEKGRHFYSDSHDNLKRGLFTVLTTLGYPCHSAQDFHNHGFLLLHCAKCAIDGTTNPSPRVALFCSQKHLKREIESLMPDATCWLSKKVGWRVCQQLLTHWVVERPFGFGEVGTVSINSKSTLVLSTMWPGRSWERETKQHIERLLVDLKNGNA